MAQQINFGPIMAAFAQLQQQGNLRRSEEEQKRRERNARQAARFRAIGGTVGAIGGGILGGAPGAAAGGLVGSEIGGSFAREDNPPPNRDVAIAGAVGQGFAQQQQQEQAAESRTGENRQIEAAKFQDTTVQDNQFGDDAAVGLSDDKQGFNTQLDALIASPSQNRGQTFQLLMAGRQRIAQAAQAAQARPGAAFETRDSEGRQTRTFGSRQAAEEGAGPDETVHKVGAFKARPAQGAQAQPDPGFEAFKASAIEEAFTATPIPARNDAFRSNVAEIRSAKTNAGVSRGLGKVRKAREEPAPTREQAGAARERKIKDAMAPPPDGFGLTRPDAIDLVDRNSEVVTTPQGITRVVNRRTGTTKEVSPGETRAKEATASAAKDGLSATANPPAGVPAVTMWGEAGNVAGVKPAIEDFWARTGGQMGFPIDERVVTARALYNTQIEMAAKAFANDDRFSVRQKEQFKKSLDISPSAFDSEPALRARLRQVDSFVASEIENAQASSENPRLSDRDRASAASTAEDLRNFRRFLGVPQGVAPPAGTAVAAPSDLLTRDTNTLTETELDEFIRLGRQRLGGAQ